MKYPVKIAIVVLFAVAMAYLESAVVAYLRGWFFPDGFRLTVNPLPHHIMLTEIGREAATIVMLVTAAWLAGRNRWDRFGYFLVLFGVWDIFYYVWLAVLIGWPTSLTNPDILFLIPEPWFGPVLAPCLVAATMIAIGTMMTRHIAQGGTFRATLVSWLIALGATVVIYLSFTKGEVATDGLSFGYPYWMLIVGLLGYALSFALAWKNSCRSGPSWS